KLFHSKATCFMCHGATGKGDGVLAAALKDVWGHPIRPANFTLPAGVKGGVELGHDGEHIFKTIMTGVGGSPMPAFQGTLKPDEVWDIVHYEQSLRVKAHGSELIAEGLKDQDLADALSGMWEELSVSAAQDRIEQALLEQELAELKSEKGRTIQPGLSEETPATAH
ncbi:MAG TPA: cytochrome c, partial [Nitrospiria bacterium]|nr:cytochrome c [Nitrospiria bacterium]